MSDDFQDEVEAINSIYTSSTLLPAEDDDSGTVYILTLSGDATSSSSSLRIKFPSTYPATSPPVVLGTHSSSGGVKGGAGARDLKLFRDVVSEVWSNGVVCIFDAVEEFGRRRVEEMRLDVVEEREQKDDNNHNNNDGDGDDDEGEENGRSHQRQEVDFDSSDIQNLPLPPWIPSDPIIDSKSTFLAHAIHVTSPSQAKLYIRQLLHSDKRILNATHNMTAWRIRGMDPTTASSSSSSSTTTTTTMTTYQDCDDDGETAAGGRMLRLLQLMDVWNVAVVVSRWYGGIKLGPRRFGIINQAAKDAVIKAGLGGEKEKLGKGKKK